MSTSGNTLDAVMIFFSKLGKRERDQSTFDLFERNARISPLQGIGQNSRCRAVQELLGSQSRHNDQPEARINSGPLLGVWILDDDVSLTFVFISHKIIPS